VDDDLNTHSEARDDSVDGASSPDVWFTIAGNFQPNTTISKERFPVFHCDRKSTSVAYAENFHGGSFRVIWWSFVFGVRSL